MYHPLRVWEQPIADTGTQYTDTGTGTCKHVGKPMAVVVYAQHTYGCSYGICAYCKPWRVITILDAY